MVVRCSGCNILLRVDEKNIEEKSIEWVRCPKCGAEGILEKAKVDQDGKTGPVFINKHPESEVTDRDPKIIKHAESSPLNPLSENPHEMTMPEDAFREFRFPVEADSLSERRSALNSRPRIIVLGLASLLIIAVFATLVNIILPGPPPASVEHIYDPTTHPQK
ncbi:MAG: hypothetical protein V1897_17710 [Pseudomonadota bacterium]